MSWYIQQLLRNSVEITSRADIDAEDFNDLLVVNKRIVELYSDGIITDEEISMIKYIEDGKPIANSKEGFGKNRISLSRDFVSLCNKIAYYIGGEFTDEGYLEYMRKKYKLDEEKIQRLQEYIKSKYKNKLIRKKSKRHEQTQ